MQGTITVASQLGQGSEFTIYCELDVVEGSAALYEAYQLPELPHKILIVGDQPIEMQVMCQTLKSVGMHANYKSPKEAVRELNTAGKGGQPYDVLITDTLTAQTRIKKLHTELNLQLKQNRNERKSIKIVVMDVSERGEFPILNEQGIDAYLTRPVRAVSLFARLNQDYARPQNWAHHQHSQSHHKEETSTSQELERTGPTILLAEDNDINALLAKTILKKLNANVIHVPNGQAAVNVVKEQDQKGLPLDYILMDIHMPEMDGFTATETIRSYLQETQNIKMKSVPIIAMTANAFPEDKEKCLAVGMNDHLAKPFEAEELKELLEKWSPSQRDLHDQKKIA